MVEKLLCGVDLGGTKLSVGLFTRDGKPVATDKVTDHRELSNDSIVERIGGLVNGLLMSQGVSMTDIEGVGVGLAGHVNSGEGIVITSSNFPRPFQNYPFRKKLKRLVDAPVIVDNDANAQAFGEYMFGAGRGRSNMVFMTVSTGVGAGMINEGRLIRGHSGFAGEIGHTIVEPRSPLRCTCGNSGCLMALSGTLGLRERYAAYLEEGMISSLGFTAESLVDIDGITLEKGLESGDEISMRLFRESADYIGIGIYNLYQVINPQTVILGGGLMKLGHGFIDLIRNKFESLVHSMVQDELEIVPAELASQAGLLGAAALPLEER